ncbi:alpha/beta hydrolase fold domain-containing protein [bacterium]|nr:alpha/beta hydrolase fold domain-containing protein [bacterium]
MHGFNKILAFMLFSVCLNIHAMSADEDSIILPPSQPEESYVYKQTPQGELKMYFNFPMDWKLEDKRPAIVFFFGGGWNGGSVDQFAYQAAYFARRGLVAARADYRVFTRHATSATACVEDAKSAVRWLREKAFTLGIDENRIIAAGGSAGAHIAACAYTAEGYEAPGENTVISSKPNLLVLFNPVLDASADRWRKRVGDENTGRAISPLFHWSKETPPTVMFFGKDDSLFPPAVDLMKTARDLEAPITLYIADGEHHGFFNKQPWLDKTLDLADQFLIDNGYLNGEPQLTPNIYAEMTRYESIEPEDPIQKGRYQAKNYIHHHRLSERMELSRRFKLGLKLNVFDHRTNFFDYDLEDETFEVYVPEDYDKKTPYGLLVYISPSESGAPPWKELPEVLKKRKMIYIGANKSGNQHDVYLRRIPLALDAAHNIQERYNIDKNRVYVFGISGGGRTASMTAFHHPDVWKGAAFFIGVNYWEDMRNPDETRRMWRASFNRPDPKYIRMAAENGRYVFLTGDKDGNRAQTHGYYERAYSKFLTHCIYYQVPGMGHERPPFEWMLKTLDFIDPQD